MWPIRQIFNPLSYMLIRHDGLNFFNSRQFFEILVPILFGVVVFIISINRVVHITMHGNDGYFSNIYGLYQILAPFFLAALAATATFSNKNLEKPLRGRDAYVMRWDNQLSDRKKVIISRRAYITSMIGYLSWACIFMYLFHVAGVSMRDYALSLLSENTYFLVRCIALSVSIAALINIVFVTFGCIYYFSHLLNSEEAEG